MIEPKRITKKSKLKPIEGGEPPREDNPVIEEHILDRLYKLLQRKYDLRFNIMVDKAEFKIKGSEDNFRFVNKRAFRTLKVFARRSNFKNGTKEVSMEDIEDIVDSGFFLPEVHPLKEYLENLKWDRKDHIKTFCNCLKLDNDNEFTVQGKNQTQQFYIVMKRWFLNSCAIIFNKPGAGNGHVMPIIEGGQGKGKGTFIDHIPPKRLRENYSYSGHIVPVITDVTASNMLVERAWVHMDDQIKSFTGKDAEEAKAFITSDNVPDRKRYGISTENKPRTASFIASCNGRDIFTDIENRRYIVFCIDNNNEFACDFEKLQLVNMDNVFAQAMHLLNHGEPYLYTSEEREMIRIKNENFRKLIIEEEAIQSCFVPVEEHDPDGHWLQATEIMAACNKALRMSLTNSNKFAESLRALGYKMIKKKLGQYDNQTRQVYRVKYIGNDMDMDKFSYNPDRYTESKNSQ